MSLFRKVGKKFEEAKQTVTGSDDVEYVCRSCGEAVFEEYEFCPHCGEEEVEPLD